MALLKTKNYWRVISLFQSLYWSLHVIDIDKKSNEEFLYIQFKERNKYLQLMIDNNVYLKIIYVHKLYIRN